MKRKAFKKVFSMLLTFSLVVSIIVTLTVAVGAQPHIIEGWVVTAIPNTHPVHPYLIPGDTLNFNYTVTQGVGAVNIGYIMPSGATVTLVSGLSVGQNFHTTVTITTAGTYKIFANRANINQTVYISGSHTVHYSATAIDSGTYFIKANHSGQYLDVALAGTANDTQVWQSYFNGGTAQQWKVTHLGGGEYNLTPMHAQTKRLDVHQDAQGAKVKIWESDNSNDQRFRLIMNSNGTYRIIPKVSHTRGLDVINSSQVNGAIVHMSTYFDQPQQQWVFEKKCVHSVSGSIVVKQGTCLKNGIMRYTCGKCNFQWDQPDVPMKPHSYTSKVCLQDVDCGKVDWGGSTKPANYFDYYMFRAGRFLNWIDIGEYGAYNDGSGLHYGIDLTNSTPGETYNSSTYSVGTGTVYQSYFDAAYGNLVKLSIGSYKVYYAHLDSRSVSAGQSVTHQTLIGKVGNTGNSQGNHLHFELRNSSDAHNNGVAAYNPTNFYPKGVFKCTSCVYNWTHTCKYK